MNRSNIMNKIKNNMRDVARVAASTYAFAALAIMSATAAKAVDAIWTNTTATAANWTTVGNWVSAEDPEVIASAFPSGTVSTATFRPPALWQKVTMPKPTPNSNNSTFSIGTVTGGSVFERLQLPDWIGSGPSWRNYSFGDLSGYLGSLNPLCCCARVKISGVQSDVRISDMGIAYKPELNVPDSVSLTLDSLHQGGAIDKTGAGLLTIKASSVPDSTILYHKAGTIVLEGAAEDGGLAPAGEPMFWLDASRTNLMDLAFDADSERTYVTHWYDRRRPQNSTRYKGYTSYRSYEKYTPWISENTLNGMPLVDFGDNENGTAATAKGSSAAVTFNNMPVDENTAVSQEVFAVVITRPCSVVGRCRIVDNNGSQYNISANLSTATTTSEMKNGIRRYDGRDQAYSDTTTVGRPHILNIAPAGKLNCPCDMGWTRNYDYKGGFMVAEAIIYTNVLTHAERAQTTLYLQRKWMGSGDVEVLSTASNSCKVEVPEGREVRVVEGVVNGTALAKTGGGVLKVGRFRNGSPSVEIEGGAVAFDEAYRPASEDAPAADPLFWGDANSNSFVYASEPNVSRWNDCRPGQTTYYATSQVSGIYPTFVDNACNGMPVLDFGTTTDTEAWMQINCSTVIKEVFLLVRRLDGTTGASLFGGSSYFALCGGSNKILGGYACKQPNASFCTVNGKTYDPVNTAITYDANDYAVASMSCEVAQEFHKLTYNSNNKKWGHVRIGEFIAYDRHLTDRERRQTIAYLMKKWRNETYDFAAAQDASFGTMTFKSGGDTARIVADVDTTISSLVLNGQTRIVKTGAGTVTCAAATLPSSLDAVSLEGGLDLGEGAEVSVASLAGGGVLGADAVSGISSLDVKIDSDWNVSTKSVVGSVSFASSLTVAFDVADPASVEVGEYPILTASGGILSAPSSITVTGLEGLSARKLVSVSMRANGLFLSIRSPGFMIIVK